MMATSMKFHYETIMCIKILKNTIENYLQVMSIRQKHKRIWYLDLGLIPKYLIM